MKKTVAILITMLMVMSVMVVLASGTADKDTQPKVPVIIGFKDKYSQADKGMIREHGGDIKYSYTIINAIAAKLPGQAIDKLEKNPRVAYVEMDAEVHALESELDKSWGVEHIGAGVVHGYNKGRGVKVAIIDTGIDHTHPDLDGNYHGGHDYVNVDDDPMDDNGHGTHCAGIVAAEDNDIGVIGVAPEAYLYGVKVLNSGGSGSISDVAAGIQWSITNNMDVISMSLGGSLDSQTLHDACVAADENGIVVVAAAGNDGNPPGKGDNVGYPARYSSVIAVAATDINDNRPFWSSTGPDVELAAPGAGIYSTIPEGKYGTMSGTSMACPHVAGTAALVMTAYPSWTNIEVRNQLRYTADGLGPAGIDEKYGFGLVDADEAAPPTDTTDPAAVTNLTVTTISCTQLNLAWDANTETDLDHYNVYTTSDGTYDLIASSTTNSYSDIGLTASTTYYYVVSAVDTSGNEGVKSDMASGTTSEDVLGPVTSNVVADPNPTKGVTSVTLTADVDDLTTGNSKIVAAEYRVNDGSGMTMGASDDNFDSSTESVTATIDISEWYVGQYTLFVRSMDAKGIWGEWESVVLDVTEEPSNIMYVENIVFSSKVSGPNKFLYTTVKVVDGNDNPFDSVRVEMTLDGTNDDSWNFAGNTGTDGTVKFTLLKAPSGYYTTTVNNLIFTDYIWDVKNGVTSASCDLKDDGTVIP